MAAFDDQVFDGAAFETAPPTPPAPTNKVYGTRRGRVTEWTIILPTAA